MDGNHLTTLSLEVVDGLAIVRTSRLRQKMDDAVLSILN